jgi:periplasmic protein TonB
MKDLPLRPDDLLELFEIDRTATAAPEGARPEPALIAAPGLAEFDEPERPDPGRLDDRRAIAEPGKPRPAPRRTALPLGIVGSLGVHLLPLLVLIHWTSAPAEIAAPIPVQLVVEEPPAPPPPPLKAEKPPPPGRLASDDFGDPKAQLARPTADSPGETLTEETRIAALPPPKPMPPPELVSALPKPAPSLESTAPPEEPKPNSLVDAPVKMAAVGRLGPNPRSVPRAQNPGPAATRDAYLAYCMSLIRGHLGSLSAAFLGGRRGAATLHIQVLGDGTIAHIAVAQPSPHPDIDARIEQAVAAVGRFPPVPQWFQGPRISLTLHLSYPDGL